MTKTRPIPATRSVQVAQGGVAIIIEVKGNARITVHLGPRQTAQPRSQRGSEANNTRRNEVEPSKGVCDVRSRAERGS
jgi:hypothetical protein